MKFQNRELKDMSLRRRVELCGLVVGCPKKVKNQIGYTNVDLRKL